MDNDKLDREINNHILECVTTSLWANLYLSDAEEVNLVRDSDLVYMESILCDLVMLQNKCDYYLRVYREYMSNLRENAISEILSILKDDIRKLNKLYLRLN